MEELSVKQFAERRRLGEVQVRRILEHPDRYPWDSYGIEHAHKVGRSWRIRLKDPSVAVQAQGSAQLVDRLAWAISSLQKSYPIAQALGDLETLPIGQVVDKAIKRLPDPAQVLVRLAKMAREGPPPEEVLLRVKPFLR